MNYFRLFTGIFLLCSLLPIRLFAFDELCDADIRSLSLGRLNALSYNIQNPASTAFLKEKTIGVSVFNRFSMSELNTKSLFCSFPNPIIDAAAELSAYGYDEYQLLGIRIGLSKRVSEKFAIGVNVAYINENSVLLEESNSLLTADAGLFWRINEKFDFALATKNLIRTVSSLPQNCYVGVTIRVSENFHTLLEGGSDFRGENSLSAGAEYFILEKFTIRAGFRNNPKTPSLGFAYKIGSVTTETCFLMHPVLGLSSGIALKWNL
ncbi:MAG: hypothetical protein LBR13_02970 [Dysgonamonadaceae bacterium]|jgi:hypothetical protein|nr:hypothetical protein [Dysgonamonadaceae bacterium]